MTSKNLLNHDTSLKSSLLFDVIDSAPLFEDLVNPNNSPVYALMAHSVSSGSKKFSPIHIMYLFNLDTLQFEDISVSDSRFKPNDVKAMLVRSNVEDNSIIITLDKTPFSMTATNKFFENKSYTHVVYKKDNFIPMVDYTKNYLQGQILISMLSNKNLSNNDVKDMAMLWNTDMSQIMCKISEKYGVKSTIIFKK